MEKNTTDFGDDDLGYALTVQRDGKIVLSGGTIGRNGPSIWGRPVTWANKLV